MTFSVQFPFRLRHDGLIMSIASRTRSLALLSIAFSFLSCSHGAKRPPEAEALPVSIGGHDIETIAILGTNDIHGALAAQDLKTREPEGAATIDYQAGGVATIASYVKVLRDEFGSSFMWLDAGDEFQGSIESNLDQGAPMVQFFNSAKVNAAAIGNHEFDFGPDKHASPIPGTKTEDRLGSLKARISEAKYPYLSANIANQATGAPATDLLPGLLPHAIYSTGKVKIGVIGLTTEETPRTTSSVNIRMLSFTNLKDAALKEATELRRAGADLVVFTAHVGLKCERGRSSASSHVRKPTEPQGDCGSHDEMVRLLKSLPAGTVDAVVAGHSHQIVHHWVAGVPVIEGGAFGRYINVIYLNYDLKEHKLLTDLTRIEGPIPVCPKVFQNQNDCNGDRPAPRNGRGALVSAQFHGQKISEDDPINDMLKPVLAKSAEAKKVVVGQVARPVDHDRFKESALGDIVADAMRDATGSQVALMNSGGIRANWEQGSLTYGDVFRTLPFDNTVVRVHVTGKELKNILRLAESGSRGFFPVSGVKLRILHPEVDAPGDDLNGDGKIDNWEMRRLQSVALEDGTEIRDDAKYTLATLDFLLTGGDDLGWAMLKIPQDRQDPPSMLLRDAVLERIKKVSALGPINSFERPIIDPKDPRMKFEKPAGKKGKGSRKRGRKKARK